MKVLDLFSKLWHSRDLRKKVGVTLFLLVLVRAIAHVPMPGINPGALQQFFQDNQFLGILDIFSGGTLSRVSVALLGVGPYITSSIIMQLLTMVVPSLEELQKEGEWGRNRINQYSRMLTVPIGILQSFGLLTILRNADIFESFDPLTLITLLITTTAATLLLMWLGELISENGIGNGISLIITLGILSQIPAQAQSTFALVFGQGIIDTAKLTSLFGFAIIALITVAFVVLMNEAIRKIPISYARAYQRATGNVDTFLPLKVNASGVIPIIFALSIIIFPSLVARFMQNAQSDKVVEFAGTLNRFFDPNGLPYAIIYFVLVFAFTYFYTSVIFKPKEVAENLQKRSGFIPGVRPGSETASYLGKIVNRITLPGAMFLGLIAILPFIMQAITKVNTLVIGGTGVLIVVSVVLETAAQMRAQLIQRSYEIYYR